MAQDATTQVDLSRPRSIHVIGVGGTGMRAIASVLVAMGHKVSGSDAADSAVLERLRGEGVDAWVGSRPDAVAGAELLTASTAVPAEDPEKLAAAAAGATLLTRADILAAIAGQKDTVAIAGTHGKTTTTSMLAHILLETDQDPSFIVGQELLGLGTGARWSDGPIFVVEADESDSTFLALPRRRAIVTNIEADHLSHHGTFENLRDAFSRFMAETPDSVLVCADDSEVAELGADHNATTYGVAETADYRVVDLTTSGIGTTFAVVRPGLPRIDVQLPLPGMHNVLNATAAIATAVDLGVDPELAGGGLANFAGVARRFQPRGELAGVTFVDDYAHLPTEVDAALEAANAGGWGRVVCTFQPHRYTRTSELWQDFTDAFTRADKLILTGIYSSGEEPIAGVTGRLLHDAVVGAHPTLDVVYAETLDDVENHLVGELKAGDLCLTLGAGDLTTMADRVLARMAPEAGETPATETRASQTPAPQTDAGGGG
jgi:UDP-N-acetylmuramate--alanine ligase